MTRKKIGTLLGALAITIAGCSDAGSIGEVARVPSPAGVVDAVLTEGNYGATVSYAYRLYIVPAGRTVDGDDDNPVLLADHVEDLTLTWTAPKRLELAYERARIFEFRNFWHSKEIDDFRYIVEIRLMPKGDQLSSNLGDTDHSLSAPRGRLPTYKHVNTQP